MRLSVRSLVHRHLILSITLLGGSAAIQAQVGSVLQQQKISVLEGGFTGTLAEDEYFGYALAPLGDLDGDGTGELAVATREGGVWILFLAPDGSVLAQVEIDILPGWHGASLAPLGDLDGDGLGDLAVGITRLVRAPLQGLVNKGAIEILFLRADGTVRATHTILQTDPVFVPAVDLHDAFAYALAGLGDVDGNGAGDLAVGAPYDDDGPGTYNGAVWIVRLERDGRARSAQKISELFGGGNGMFDANLLGTSVASLGDLDRDGNVDLVVGVPAGAFPLELHDPRLLVLFLDEDERLRSVRAVRQAEFGCGFDCGFASALAVLGDLDGDGTLELGIGASLWTPTPGPHPFSAPREGGFLIGSLRRDGSLARRLLVTPGRGGLGGPVPLDTLFGAALAPLGDLDRDGMPELAVGANQDDDGAEDTGSVWILELDASPLRNGTGVNPLTLREDEQPSSGHTWQLALDCSGHGPGLAYVAGFAAPLDGLPTPAGELLVDAGGSPRFFQFVTPHAGTPLVFVSRVPREVGLIGQVMYVQGLCTGAPRMRLSNALDVIVGR